MQAFSEHRLKEYRERSGNTSFLPRFKDTTESMARRLITTNKGHIGMAPYVESGKETGSVCFLAVVYL
jgi:hypothetical protein